MRDEKGSTTCLSSDLRERIEGLLPRYPTRQAVVLPALHLINEHLHYVPPEAVVELARLLELAPAQVQDTLSFYGFFKQDRPQGEYRVWVCRSIACAARGGEELLEYLCDKLGIRPGETTSDGRISLDFAECLGACDQAPAMLVNETLYGNVTEEMIDELINNLVNDDIQSHSSSPRPQSWGFSQSRTPDPKSRTPDSKPLTPDPKPLTPDP